MSAGRISGNWNVFTGEFFTYDDLDRLTGIQYGNGSAHDISYAPNGNITMQTDIGRYYYEGSRPHAVTSVDNTRHRIPTSQLQTQFNVFGKVSQIRDYGENNYKMLFDYGPDNERWRTRFYRNTSTLQRTTYYMGDYEEIVEGGITRRLYYLDGNVLYKKQTSQPDSVFYLFTDHLGSVVTIVDQNGSEKFRATYDAWGNQTVTRNDIGFRRGYTGHEMLPEFGLINMNGRLYDPQIGRFLSTDNYVQQPWNSQNFNRYSYCLNNPLKYTDPSGEWFGIDDLLIVGASFMFGYVSSGISTGNWGWNSVQSGLTSAAISWIGYNSAGLATGAIKASTWNSVASMGVNTAVNMIIPPVNIPIGDFNMSFSPAFGFGEGGLNAGLNAGLAYSDGNWHFGATAGFGSTYIGWYGEGGYGKFSAGYGATYYNSTTIGDYTSGRQIVGTGKISWGDYSLSVSNDLFAENQKDRWRTSAVELGIGDFLVGTSVFTNWGAEESPIIDGTRKMPVNDPIIGKHLKDKANKSIGSWRNGQVLSAPFWVGYRNVNQAFRIGASAKVVQSLTQNLVHKFMDTPYFIHYNNFKSGPFSYYGYYNPLTLWNK